MQHSRCQQILAPVGRNKGELAVKLCPQKNTVSITTITPAAQKEAMTTFHGTPLSAWQSFCRKLVLERLARIQRGKLRITLPNGQDLEYGDPASKRIADLHVHDNDFFSRIVLGADVGLGEAYVDGLWDSTDVAAFFALLIHNRDLLEDGSFLVTVFSRTLDRIRHLLRDNSIRGSRRNIHEHYDLGNDFYKTFLDPSMMYSCGIHHSPDESLEQAQKNKNQAFIDKLRISPNDHILEIGCGWGGFAVEAARQTGCRVTGITISSEQKDWANERVKREGLADRIDIQLIDYRNIEGRFDRIVSIEMLEAVGHRWLKHFFYRCDNLLKPGGLMGLQTITIPCEKYDDHRKGTDWIRKHIFPGGHLPSLTAIREAITGHTSLTIHDMQEIGLHYADTLREWRHRFTAQLHTIESLGLDKTFQRKWNYYLASCEGGFATKATGNVQIVLAKKP
ncbi:MAG: class I SAM-dependent methyltransferase [Oxalobacter sp.]|nr:MAG: class I SAM-dependent methyltransferase [Oxalobacter sp.]